MSLDEMKEEAFDDLRNLLMLDTRNPPPEERVGGTERPAIEYIERKLREAGLEPTILESDGRPNLVVRIPGDGSAGGPLLLAGHVDVVPVETEHWSHDPFAGVVDGGYLFGRGAIDMKHMVTHCMAATLRLARSGVTPNRDVIFAAVADEEAGCTHGSRFLVEQHPELVRADYMLGEFGGFSMDINGVRYYPIQVAERGNCKIRMTARGTPGHGSIPHGDQAVVKLATAIAKLGNTRLPQHPTGVAMEFFKTLALTQPPPAKFVLPQLTNKLLSNVLLDRVLPDKEVAANFAATLSNTVSPTMLEAGQAMNVIPGEASCVLDGRTVPGQTKHDLLRELRDVVGPDVEFEVLLWAPGREGTVEDPLYRMIVDITKKHDPSGIPLPMQLTGFTDAQYFGRIVTHCFGFSPVQFPAADNVSFNKMVHGHDERIHVEGFKWGVGVFWDLVSTFLGVDA